MQRTAMSWEKKLLTLIILQVLSRSIESKGQGYIHCKCGAPEGRPIDFRASRSKEERLSCDKICMSGLAFRKCSTESCEEEISRDKSMAEVSVCKDEFDGKLYMTGQSWRRNCTINTCGRNSVTQTAVGCPQICLIGTNKFNKCCPVCKRRLTCTPKEITVAIHLPLLRGADPKSLTLSDPNCRSVVNSSHVSFTAGLASCGMKLRRTERGFIYSNFVQKTYTTNQRIIRPWLRFSCLFYHKISHSEALTAPSFKVTISTIPQDRKLAMYYTNAVGEVMLGQKKLRFVKGSPVYVLVAVKDIPSKTHFLVVESCSIASPRKNRKYQLILKGCPVDTSLDFKFRSFNRIWFSFKAKKPPRHHESNYLDLTCQAAVCSRRANSDICNRKC